MDVTPLIRANAQVIQSYRGGVFKVSNIIYEHPIIVTVDHVLSWSPSEPVCFEDFAILEPLKGQVEVFLLGTGAKQIFLAPSLKRQIKESYGFTVETMDTGAACRTYNVLMAEGRLVAVGLVK